MKIKVNGQIQEFDAAMSIMQLAENLRLNPKQVAVEHNCSIVPRSNYAQTMIDDGDQIEIVHFIGGG